MLNGSALLQWIGIQHLTKAPVEAFAPTVGMGMPGRDQAMLNAHQGAFTIESVLTRGGLAPTGKAVSDRTAVISENLDDLHGHGLLEPPQENGSNAYSHSRAKPSMTGCRWLNIGADLHCRRDVDMAIQIHA